MSDQRYTPEEMTAVFEFLRSRTVDNSRNLIPQHTLYGVMHKWFADNGYGVKLENRTMSAILKRAGYQTVNGNRKTSTGHQIWVVLGLDLLPKEDG
ncbi:primase-like DNA-binding domain-containing protein [Streptomyces sp. NPDC058206]|uniref:primase-like DNA-binding domain-containing protein n=1 Tax=Streptomyces sp. NPDC058206 TaxID=3346382 RepID=UPI0036EB1113